MFVYYCVLFIIKIWKNAIFSTPANVDLFLETAILKRLSDEVSILYSLKRSSQQISCFIVYLLYNIHNINVCD